MSVKVVHVVTCLLTLSLPVTHVLANVTPHVLFSDNMVQQEMKTKCERDCALHF